MLQQEGRSRATGNGGCDGATAARRPPAPAGAAVVVVPQGAQPFDGSEVLQPMLAAVVRLAGAAAAVVRVTGADNPEPEPVAAVRADRACRHVVAVPVHRDGRQVGTLDLMFAEAGDLAPALVPRLPGIGDLLGAVLGNAERARAAMRNTLMTERQAMANEVHDSLAQSLTYMRMRMSLLSDAIRERDELRAFKYWSDVDDSLTHAHQRLRELITCFRSRMDPQGLLHALNETAAHFFDRTGVVLEVTNRAGDFYLPPGREVEVHHVVQEALANICRHAGARHARISLDRTPAGYEIVIEDDGIGLAQVAAAGDPEQSGHYGIAIMQERARRLGGELVIEGAAGAGTRVRLAIPIGEPHGRSEQ